MIKKLIGAALGAGMLLASISPAFAATRVKMIDTGPLSLNEVLLNRTSKTTVTNDQDATVTNNVISVANSGLNFDILNTKSLDTGSRTTGKATSKVNIENNVNAAITVVNECGTCEDDTKVVLDQTGPLSKNTVNVTDNKTITVSTPQNATVTNNVISVANSGLNVSALNTKTQGTGATGDAKSKTDVINWVNTSQTYINTTPPPTL